MRAGYAPRLLPTGLHFAALWPGAIESTEAALPDWLPVYPGAISYPKEKISWLMTPTAVFLTRDSTRRVYDYYLQAIRDAGARLTEYGISRNVKVPADESPHHRLQG